MGPEARDAGRHGRSRKPGQPGGQQRTRLNPAASEELMWPSGPRPGDPKPRGLEKATKEGPVRDVDDELENK